MKTRIILCFLVIAVFFTGQSLANQSAEFEPEYPALTFLKEKGQWEKFIATAKSNKAVVTCHKADGSNAECLRSDYVAKGAFVFASKNPQLMNLVAENQRGETAYMDLFMAYNNFPKGGGLPLEQFQKLATGQIPDTGILYPVNSEYLKAQRGVNVAQAPESVKTDAVPAITMPAVKPAEVAKPSEAEVKISGLQKQIAEMKKAFAGGNAEANKRLGVLEKSLKDLAENVESVGKGQKDLAQNQVKISASMEEIAGALAELKNQNNATKSGIYEDIKAMADAVEHNQMIIVIIVISLSVVIVLLSLYFWFTNRSTRKIANEAKGIAEKADGKAGFATSLVKKQEADLGLVIESVDELLAVDSDDCKGLFICDEAKLSKEFTMNLPVGESIEVIVRFSEKDWRIIFFRASETHFNVIGIKRTKSAKSSEMDVGYLTNLADFIRKAYKDHRISAKEVEEAIAA